MSALKTLLGTEPSSVSPFTLHIKKRLGVLLSAFH